MSGRTLRVLLLEDNPEEAQLLAQELSRGDLDCVTTRVDSEESFRRALREFAPDVILSNHSIAHFNAIEALRALRACRPSAPLIIVSASLDERMAVECMRSGAEDIVLKENLHRLVPAISAALAVREPLERLSPRQLEVLCLVAEGLTTRQIACRLELSAKTVETHRGEIMKRLGIHNVVGLVHYALRLSLVIPEQ